MEREQIQKRITDLYALFASGVLLKARSIVRDQEDALDILQVVFERLYLKARREQASEEFESLFCDDSQIHAYLYRIAINESYRLLQKKEKAPELFLPDWFVANDESDTLQSHIRGEEIAKIKDYIMLEADEREQTLFYLLFFEETKQKEIAEVLGVTDRYVRTLQKQLVQKLKRRVSAN